MYNNKNAKGKWNFGRMPIGRAWLASEFSLQFRVFSLGFDLWSKDICIEHIDLRLAGRVTLTEIGRVIT
jgi:hypothetical protein